MKRGELHRGGQVSFLTERVVMALKQQRAILVRGGRACGIGIICKTIAAEKLVEELQSNIRV